MRRPFARPNPLLRGAGPPFPRLARITLPPYRLLGATKSPEVNLDTPSAPEQGAPYTAYIHTADAQREVFSDSWMRSEIEEKSATQPAR